MLVSHDRFVDVIPTGTGTRVAVDYQTQRWRESGTVVTCSSAGRDVDLLTDERFLAVVVENADDHLRRETANRDHVYYACHRGAVGLLEGIRAHRVWPLPEPSFPEEASQDYGALL